MRVLQAAVVVVVVLTPALLLLMVDAAAAMALAIVIIGAAPAVLSALRGKLFETPIAFLGLSFVFFYGVSAYGALIRGLDASPTYQAAGLTSIYGLLVSYAGYFVFRSPARTIAGMLPSFGERWRPRRLRMLLFVLLVLGTIGLVARFAAAGTFDDEAAAAPAALQTHKLSGANWSIPLLLAPGVALVLSLAYARRSGSRRTMLLWVLAALAYVVVYAFVGSRSRILFAFVPVLSVYHLVGPGIRTWRLLLGLALALFAYIGFGQVRDTLFSDSPVETKTSSFAEYASNHGDLMVFRATMDVMECFPDYYDYRYGSTLVVPITNWVPRSIWPDKPLPASAVYTAAFDPVAWERGVTGVTGLIGEFYLNGGHGVVLAGMLAIGAFLRLLASYRESAPKDTGVIVMYSLMILPVATLARGDFSFVFFNAQTALTMALVCLAFGLGLSGRRARHSASAWGGNAQRAR